MISGLTEALKSRNPKQGFSFESFDGVSAIELGGYSADLLLPGILRLL